MDRANRRREYERAGFFNLATSAALDTMTFGLYTSSWNPLQQHAERYETAVQAAQQYFDQHSVNGQLTVQQTAEFRQLLQVADQHLQSYREARTATAELAANSLATAAGILVVVGSGGTATPLVVALAAGAGGATQALTRLGLDPNSFSWEQLTTDALMGAVNAGTAALSLPANVTGGGVTFGIIRRIAGSAFGGGAIAGGLATTLNGNTWQEGFAVGFLRVTGAALTTGALSAALPTMVGAGLYFARRPAIANFVRTFIAEEAGTVLFSPALWRQIRAARATGQTMEDALASAGVTAAHLDSLAARVANAAAGETEQTLRAALRELVPDTMGGIQRNLVVEAAIDTWAANRNSLAGVTRATLSQMVEVAHQGHSRAIDAVVNRLAAMGITPTTAQLDSLLERLATRTNLDDAAVRAELQAIFPGHTFSDQTVRQIRGCIDPNVPLTGQLHHVISRRVHNALEAHPTLQGLYEYRDPRFTVTAIDLSAHNGWFGWHQELDNQIATWLALPANQSLTAQEFEAWLRTRYSEPDLFWRFPTGF